MKFLIFLISLPLLIPAYVMSIYPPKGIRRDLQNCLHNIKASEKIPETFIHALVFAEDHRSHLHQGVDPIAILRSFYVKIKTSRWQGASTIEQQYVRVITKKYERKGARKIREQILAIMLSRKASKASIASAYLSVAFYGTQYVGKNGLHAEFGSNLDNITFDQALKMMVQLKYPKPREPNSEWTNKHSSRLKILQKRLRDQQYVATSVKPSKFKTTNFNTE